MTGQLSRRGFLGGAAGALSLPFLSSCMSGAQSSGDSDLRVFMFLTGSDWTAFKGAAKAYQKDHRDHDMVLSHLGGGATVYLDKLRTQLAGGSAPDIFHDWGGELAAPFIRSKLVAPLDKYYEQYGWENILLSDAVQMCSMRGKRYGVPVALRGLGIVYRKDIFGEHGLGEATSYEELEDICETLHSAGIVPMAVGGSHAWHPMRLVQFLLEHTAGPSLHDDLLALRTSWKRPEVEECFALFKRWVDKGWLPNGFMGTTYDSALLQWFQGKAAMFPDSPTLEGDVRKQGIDAGVFVFPTDAKPPRFMSYVEQLMLPVTSAQHDVAAQFIDWYVRPQTQQKYYASGTATIKGIPEDESAWPLTYEWQKIKKSHESYLILDQAFDKELANSYFAIQAELANGSTTPKQAAADMQKAVESAAS